MFSFMWLVMLLLTGNALTLCKWRWDARRFRTRLDELESRLSSEAQKRQDLESAIDTYYVPNWRDATERLGVPVICTCPPYRYRSTCLKHSPEMLKRQVNELKQIERKFFEPDSMVYLSESRARNS